MSVRLGAGAVHEELDVEGVGPVAVRYERCPAGWQASFTLAVPEAPDLDITHRLVTGSIAEARRAVPEAVAFLLGRDVGSPASQA